MSVNRTDGVSRALMNHIWYIRPFPFLQKMVNINFSKDN